MYTSPCRLHRAVSGSLAINSFRAIVVLDPAVGVRSLPAFVRLRQSLDCVFAAHVVFLRLRVARSVIIFIVVIPTALTLCPVYLTPECPAGGKKVGDCLFRLFGADGHRPEFIAVAQLFHAAQEYVDLGLHGGAVRLCFLFSFPGSFFSSIGSFLGGYRALFPTGGRFIGPLKLIGHPFYPVLEPYMRHPVIFQPCEQQIYEFLLFHFSKVGAPPRRDGGSGLPPLQTVYVFFQIFSFLIFHEVVYCICKDTKNQGDMQEKISFVYLILNLFITALSSRRATSFQSIV